MCPVDFAAMVYAPTQDLYGRPVTVTPAASQPGAPAYQARGILDTDAIEVAAIDGSVLSTTNIILDILETEYAVVPIQGDRIDVPAVDTLPAEGSFEVVDADPNGGGETTLTLRRLVPAKP